ncbi:hypothetical protein BN946_scf184911.g67 [Trametes cinnabarina]|uniref:Uncharacterized protein n=1 Tax=Pycnoporus cinnabarinus TaxID=5643 RepID=A0A060SAQ9_PYCCI|nr:hypothetical protein BN946_scf184911.g67 [Trametes cinnabarina]
MSLSALTSAIIGLEVSNVALLSLLLATPAPKHPMVKSLMIACLLRSALDVLPSIVEKTSPRDFAEPGLNNRAALVSFCVSDSIFSTQLILISHSSLSVWALPVLLVAVPNLIKGRDLWVWYQINTCYFDDNAFTIVSLVFTLVPLALAVFISASVVCVLRWSRVQSQRNALCSSRSLRFGALVFVTIVSASLYAVVLVKWIKGHKDPWNSSPAEPLHLLMRTSVIWEAITPFLFFLIFAAQEEIYETWLGWFSRFLRFPPKEHDGRVEDSRRRSQYTVTYDSYISPTNQATYSRVPHELEMQERSSRPTLPGKILPRLSSYKFLRQTYSNDRHRQGTTPGILESGLSPPPRTHLPHPHTAEDSPLTPRFRLPFLQNLSLSAFGSQPSMYSQPTSTAYAGDLSGDDGGVVTITEESGERPTGELHRPDTPLSTRTFGRATTSRR